VQSRFKKAMIIFGVLLLIFILNYEILTKNSWSNWHLPLAGKIIVLDAGHGGPDGGAEGGDIVEKDISLSITKKLRDYLQQAGALVIMTREEDMDLANHDTKGLSRRKAEDLKRRAKLVEDSDADMFISVHLNAIPSEKWRGAQTFYHPKSDKNKKLAAFIQDSLREQLENTDRQAKSIGQIYLLKKVEVPAALVEVGFLSNHAERGLLQTKKYQKKVAESIYHGIMRYYTKEKPPKS
jgi:N-acetylmuramoyl-L-alanine amidase